MRPAPIEALAAGIRSSSRPVAVLAGAGVSQTAGVATGEDLLRLLAAGHGEDPGPDPVTWYVTRFGRFPDYFAMAEDAAGGTDAGDVRPVLPRRLFEGTTPTPAHRALAAVAAQGLLGPFLTTNFDQLLEQALREAGLEPRVAYDLETMAAAEPEGPTEPLVVKLHGDYQDVTIRDSAAALHTYHPVVDDLLDRVLSASDLLVCGWSAAWDLPLGAALARTAGRRTYWLQCGDPTPRARALMSARDALVAPVPGSDPGLRLLAAALGCS